VTLGSAEEIEAAVLRWREAVTTFPAGEGRHIEAAERAYRDAGVALRRMIWDPVAPHLVGAKRAFIVPDGSLHFVDVAALPISEDEYLIDEDPAIHYLSTERDLFGLSSEASRGKGLLALGDAAFDDRTPYAALARPEVPAEAPVLVASARPFRGERSACGSFSEQRFDPLPASGAEVTEVVASWPQSEEVQKLTGAAASEEAFKRRAPGHRALHLATHGFFLGGECRSALGGQRGFGAMAVPDPKTIPPLRGENPLVLSGLVLAGANNRQLAGEDEDDGILTAQEIAAMDLSSVEWAVLSACDTGVGEIRAGEGVFGLRRAFQVAGADTLIMSLWSVEDESARRWMKALYEGRLTEGMDTAEAVRHASLTVLNDRRSKGLSDHPFYWAGFVAAGDWR
jgi:CHAT domain-containing protein